MPKYYCDYCDIFLTHDSPSVRKSHNEGWKHKAAVRAYYSQFEEDFTQSMIDQKIKEYEARMGGHHFPTFGRGAPFAYPPAPGGMVPPFFMPPLPQGQGNIPTPGHDK